MVTISHLVKKMVQERPFLQEALRRGLINNAALAEELIPMLEKELRKEVKFSAVNMAVRRLAEQLDKVEKEKKELRFDPRTDITLKSSLAEITVFKRNNEAVGRVHEVVGTSQGDFLTITQGLHEVMIITNEKHVNKILELFQKKSVEKVIRGLCSLSITIPEEAVETVGLFYVVSQAFAWENISIIDLVSTLTEMTIIIKEEDAPRAFTTVKRILEGG